MPQPAPLDLDSDAEAEHQPAGNGKAAPVAAGVERRPGQADQPVERQPHPTANGKAAPESVAGNGKASSRYPRRHRPSKPQLRTRAELDGRTNAARAFTQLVGAIEQDLGGADQLSTIERSLIEGFAGAAITAHSLNVKIALGQEVLPAELSQCVSTMVRIAGRLGIRRRTKDVPSLSDLLLESTHDVEHEGD